MYLGKKRKVKGYAGNKVGEMLIRRFGLVELLVLMSGCFGGPGEIFVMLRIRGK